MCGSNAILADDQSIGRDTRRPESTGLVGELCSTRDGIEAMANAENDHRGGGKCETQEGAGPNEIGRIGLASGSIGELADGTRQRWEQRTIGNGTGERRKSGLDDTQGGRFTRSDESDNDGQTQRNEYGITDSSGLRWPSRPGQRQHEWESPRLISFPKVGKRHGKRDERHEGDQCLHGDAGTEEELHGESQFGVGGTANGLAGRIHSRANKAMLRILGNGWVPQIPLMIYRWIVEQENNHEIDQKTAKATGTR
jgi:hypothetical protein